HERKNRIYHFWPDSDRLEPLQGWIPPTLPVPLIRVFPDGKEAVFFGMTEVMGAGESPNLYALDIASGKARRLGTQLLIRRASEGFPLAPPRDNRSVMIDLPAGNLHQIIAVPRSGFQLLIGKPNGNSFPLVDTTPEETALPATLLADNQVAFMAGAGSDQT